MAAQLHAAKEDYQTVLSCTLQDGLRVAIRAVTIASIADLKPKMNKETGEVIGGSVIFTGTRSWNVKEMVDELLPVWCPPKEAK